MMMMHPMMMDPLYLGVMLIGMFLSFVPQLWVQKTYRKFAEVPTSRGQTGREIAERILQDNRVYDVQVEMVGGELSDHYDPGAKRVRLSSDIYNGRSISAAAIAAHEVGHAIQHATGYAPVVWRGALVPVVNLGSQLGPILIFVSLAIGFTSSIFPEWALGLAYLGALLFASSVVFHMVTLPVEIDASMRAVKILSDGRYLTTNEMPGAKKVLTSAAMTYVAVALYSLIQLAHFVFQIVMASQRNER